MGNKPSFDKNKFGETHSAIFAPFLVNIVINLLNGYSDEETYKINDFLGKYIIYIMDV